MSFVCRYLTPTTAVRPSVRPPVRRRKRRKIQMSDRHTYIHTSRVSTRELEHHTYIDGRKGVVMRGENASSSAVVMATGVSTACCTQQASSVCVCLSVCASTYLCIYHRYMYTYIYIPGPLVEVCMHGCAHARRSVSGQRRVRRRAVCMYSGQLRAHSTYVYRRRPDWNARQSWQYSHTSASILYIHTSCAATWSCCEASANHLDIYLHTIASNHLDKYTA